jgi:hypothetical protein
MKRSLALTILTVLFLGLLTACAPAAPPTPTLVPPTATLEPTATTAPTPVPEGLTLYYEENAQVELVSSLGIHVMIDVCNPSKLTNSPTADDVLLSTHTHSDHYSASFAQKFPGQTMLLTAGELGLPDVAIKAVLSSGAVYSQQVPDANTIYIVDMGGLRVAHFGDIAQKEFLPEQMEALQNVDIAIMALDSPYGDMTLENKNGFNLMDQIKPKLIIPTHHVSPEGIEYAVEKWGGYALNSPLHITSADLPTETKLLVMGFMADAYKSLYSLQEW